MGIVDIVKSYKKTSIATVIVLALLGAVVGVAWANKIAPTSWGLFGEVDASSGVAIDGYDPVAYFVVGEPKRGVAEYAYQWKNVAWHFVSDENRKLFAADPEKYAPQHGGYCAVAADTGFTATSDPESWTIKDGKLYLFVGKDQAQSWVADK